MVIRVNLPRVRYLHENDYTDRPAYHDVRYELIFMSNQNLLAMDTVREAVMRFISDVYFMEAFAADYTHLLLAAVSDYGGGDPKYPVARHLDFSTDADSSSSGNFWSISVE